MDNADCLKDIEIGLWNVLQEGHRRGLNWWQMLRLMPDIITDLLLKSECEYRLKGGK